MSRGNSGRRGGGLDRRMDEFRQMLPETFVVAYEALWAMAYNDGTVGGGEGVGRQNAESAAVGVASGKVETVGSGKGALWPTKSDATSVVLKKGGPQKADVKKVGKTAATLKSEEMFRLKKRIDQRLRRAGAEILAILEDRSVGAAVKRKCTGKCGQFGEKEWRYCPHCAGPMREVEENE